ncbi:immunoglobulin-like domain-containing protein, partial [Vallitalea sediminicola]
ESSEKIFEMIVKALEQTNEEAIAADKAWLSVYRTLGENLSQYSICHDLILPVSAPEGSIITWTSNKPEVISNSGVITRPEYEEGH